MRGSDMKPRIEYAKAAPGTVQAMRALETCNRAASNAPYCT
jgi:hypothetical protein